MDLVWKCFKGKIVLKVEISYISSMGKNKYAGNVVESHNKSEERN